MKNILRTAILLILTLAAGNIYAATIFQVIAYDRNGSQQVNAQEVQTGQDYFLARAATQAEITQRLVGLFVDKDNHGYLPVSVADLQTYDYDKNGVITAEEANQARVKIVQHLPDQFVVSNLEDNGFGVIRFESINNAMKVVLVPTSGQTPVKTFLVQLEHY